MTDFPMLCSPEAQTLATVRALEASNALSRRYGLELTQPQIRSLAVARQEELTRAGRLEWGPGVLPQLIYAFCDSPYVLREEYASLLADLQALFYTLKNESNDALSDEELIEALQRIYNGRAQGSLAYLENLTIQDLWNALNGTDDEEEERNSDGFDWDT